MSQDESIKIFSVYVIVNMNCGLRRPRRPNVLSQRRLPDYSFPPLMNALVGKIPDGRRIT